MCLAKAYVRVAADDADATLLMENVSRVAVEGDRVRLTSLLGDIEELTARIVKIDFVEGKLALESVEVSL